MQEKVIYFDLFDTLVSPDRGYLDPYFDRETDRLGDNGTLKDAKQTIERLVSLHPELIEKYTIEKMAKDYEKMMSKSIRSVDANVLKMLKDLKSAGYKLCVVSDAAYVDVMDWKKSPLSKYFDKTVFSCEVGFIKPDPRLFEYASEQMGNKKENIFIGDGGHDELAGAQSIGMKTIKAEWLKNRRDEDICAFANYQIQDTKNVLKTIEQIKIQQKEIKQENKNQQEIDTFIDSFTTDDSHNNIIEQKRDDIGLC